MLTLRPLRIDSCVIVIRWAAVEARPADWRLVGSMMANRCRAGAYGTCARPLAVSRQRMVTMCDMVNPLLNESSAAKAPSQRVMTQKSGKFSSDRRIASSVELGKIFRCQLPSAFTGSVHSLHVQGLDS